MSFFWSSRSSFLHALSAIINPMPPITNPRKIMNGLNSVALITSLKIAPTIMIGSVEIINTFVSFDPMFLHRIYQKYEKYKATTDKMAPNCIDMDKTEENSGSICRQWLINIKWPVDDMGKNSVHLCCSIIEHQITLTICPLLFFSFGLTGFDNDDKINPRQTNITIPIINNLFFSLWLSERHLSRPATNLHNGVYKRYSIR